MTARLIVLQILHDDDVIVVAADVSTLHTGSDILCCIEYVIELDILHYIEYLIHCLCCQTKWLKIDCLTELQF